MCTRQRIDTLGPFILKVPKNVPTIFVTQKNSLALNKNWTEIYFQCRLKSNDFNQTHEFIIRRSNWQVITSTKMTQCINLVFYCSIFDLNSLKHHHKIPLAGCTVWWIAPHHISCGDFINAMLFMNDFSSSEVSPFQKELFKMPRGPDMGLPGHHVLPLHGLPLGQQAHLQRVLQDSQADLQRVLDDLQVHFPPVVCSVAARCGQRAVCGDY